MSLNKSIGETRKRKRKNSSKLKGGAKKKKGNLVKKEVSKKKVDSNKKPKKVTKKKKKEIRKKELKQEEIKPEVTNQVEIQQEEKDNEEVKIKKEQIKKKEEIKKEKIKEYFFEEGNMEGGGIFCFMPYNFLDKDKKQNFKIQSSSNVHDEKLKEYYPSGFSMIAWLLNPEKGRIKNGIFLDYYRSIIDFVLIMLKEKGGQTPNLVNGKETGWIYCSIDDIHSTFQDAQTIYDGLFIPFDLVGTSVQTGEFVAIKSENNDIVHKPQFVGKMVYHT